MEVTTEYSVELSSWISLQRSSPGALWTLLCTRLSCENATGLKEMLVLTDEEGEIPTGLTDLVNDDLLEPTEGQMRLCGGGAGLGLDGTG
ncbi:uncharacterized protein MCYG_00430 [Microsporum canis CBS 113480]|uniref:Uncharacterized protein n=1 Tax=Arthroderma otae (strain ATCC MYA-4605 / CBS 113480) TaxID=554155 RepID=C5FCK8_ARTOC|nr:uncharacterized protein MCYG_00430 [Microsporum canis CBS 113480]EEQ27542.1 predicted protein [Microsporum canis CBS 113480]